MALDDTNGINADNIFATFEDYVGTTVRDTIIWGQNNLPQYIDGTIVVDSSYFGGGTEGPDPTFGGANLVPVNESINASGIYSVLLGQTRLYTQVRKLRAQLLLTGTPQSIIYDQTEKSYMADAYRQTLTVSTPSNLARGKIITSVTLESFFTTLQSNYTTKSNNTYFKQSSVCHTSCHNSCHSSRIRR